MGKTYKYVVPAVTEPLSPQEEFTVADDIQVRRSIAPGLGSATDFVIYEAWGTVAPTTANCALPCPATYYLTDTSSTSSKVYQAYGTLGAVCSGWSAQS